MTTDNTQQPWGEKPIDLELNLADRLRKSLRFSAMSVAEMADLMEVHRNSISGYLAGRTRPSNLALRFWAATTRVPLQWLLEGVWPENPTAQTLAEDAAQKPGEDDGADGAGDEGLFDVLSADTAHCLEVLVGLTLLGGGDEQPALRFIASLADALDEEGEADNGTALSLVFACLLGWLVGARSTGISGAAVVNWTSAHLSEPAAGTAIRASGLVGYPFAPNLTFNELNAELGLQSIAALVWLAAGVVSTAGGGDANWLRQFDL